MAAAETSVRRRQAAKPKPPPMSPNLVETVHRTPSCPLSPGFVGPFTPCNRDGDDAAGPQKRISASDPGNLTKFCRCIPGLILLPLIASLFVSTVFFPRVLYWLALVLSMICTLWTCTLSSGCVTGLWRMRRDVKIDWYAKLKQLQDECPESKDLMHIVFLPNYKEDEDMLDHTLKSLARSAMARETMHVVLACEEREGPEAKEKAFRLVDENRHLFADLFATFHPAGLRGDVPGKSSNNQWAFKHALEKYAFKLSKIDFSQVFITCADADTIFHPQYFSAVAYQALTMPRHERCWACWQPPILLFRNLISAPAPTRLSGYATALFEISGLSQQFVPHFMYSSYTGTMELWLHKFVRGWDRDVIAEDHHMFCKCYYASIWEQLYSSGSASPSATPEDKDDAHVRPALKLNPVYLPALSYLVQSDGYFASIRARFVQARRHSQGQAEIAYAALQHMHVILSGHANRLSLSTHLQLLSIPLKMLNVHILSPMHTLAAFLSVAAFIPGIISWLSSHAFQELLHMSSAYVMQTLLSMHSFAGFKYLLFGIFGSLPLLDVLISYATSKVVLDTLEGKLTRDPADTSPIDPDELAAPDVEGSARGPNGLGWWGRLKLIAMIQHDCLTSGLITMVLYGVIPSTMAAWFLLFKSDAGFKYVVGDKPTNTIIGSTTVCGCEECMGQASIQPGLKRCNSGCNSKSFRD